MKMDVTTNNQTFVSDYSSGFLVRQLERCRQFYRLYPIASTVGTQLNWSQYKLLISIPDADKREYKLYHPSSQQLIEQINEVKKMAKNKEEE